MSQHSVKRIKRPNCEYSTYGDIMELKNYVKELLNPLIDQVKMLTETVTHLTSIVSKGERIETNKAGELLNNSIAADVTLIGINIHSLSKHVESVREQFSEHQKKVEKLSIQIGSMEKLLTALTKMENSRKMKRLDEQMWEKMLSVEQLLLCTLDYRTTLSTSSHTADTVNVVPPKPCQVSAALGVDSTLQLITLNNESDYPFGSWLGNENEPVLRVRCPISERNLLYINTRCLTPEKMALTLLDHLFTKEELSISNLSGKGKHGKKQLDPLMIYGIKCHLVHHFNITDKQWYRIRQNMDSKCRTAWKKRKLEEEDICQDSSGAAENLRIAPTIVKSSSLVELMSDEIGAKVIATTDGDILQELNSQGRIIHTVQGNIEVLHATPEQILRYNDIQVLDADHILPIYKTEVDDCDTVIPLSKNSISANNEDITIIKTDESFVTEPMLQVLKEDSLSMDNADLSDEG